MFWFQHNLCPKTFVSQKTVGQKKCESRKNVGPEEFMVLKDFGFRIFGGTKQYWVNKIWIRHFLEYKQILVKKTQLCPKCWSEKNDHPVPFHNGLLCILYLKITLYPVTLGHPGCCKHGTHCLL